MSAAHVAPPLEFFIFGHPVGMSPSPEIHNTGFRENDFRGTYSRFDSPSAETALEKIKSDCCGGGSVTIPHKETLLKHMDELSEPARMIAAVNTVTKLAGGRLRGDNTDWIGIKRQLELRLFPAPATKDSKSLRPTCLLCGAGGTARAAAYALAHMDAEKVLVYNRSPQRGEELARDFGFDSCADLHDISQLGSLQIVINTIPGSAGFVLPDIAVLQRCQPVVLDAAYIPRRTQLLCQAIEAGCEIIEGVEMLFEQGCAQCEMWTGAQAPRSKIASALLSALFNDGSDHPARENMEPTDSPPLSLLREAGRE